MTARYDTQKYYNIYFSSIMIIIVCIQAKCFYLSETPRPYVLIMRNTFLVTICQFKTPTYNLELEANVRIGHSSLSDFLFFEKLRTVYDVLAFIEKKTQKTSTLFFVFLRHESV